MTSPTPLTELQAVNLMLSVVGDSPVNDLNGNKTANVIVAKNTLNETLIEVQMKGWHFNTEIDYPLSPDAVTGQITVPTNCVKVDTTKYSLEYDIVLRGQTLYDRKTRSSVFTKDIEAELVFLFEFAQCPAAARNYIAIRAARKFQDRVQGSDTLHSINANDEAAAKTILEEYESSTADYNIFQNYDSWKIIERNGR